ncbi:MAG: amidohydrolase family protein, partial [Actinomycetota bacterium]
MPDLLLRDVRLDATGPAVDLTIRGGRIDTVGAGPQDWDGPSVDGAGRLAMPGLVDGHAHVDKTTWGLPWRRHSAEPGSLAALIRNEREGRRELPPVAERAGAVLDAYIANGTTLLRTHVDVDPENGVTAVEGVAEAAAERRDQIEVQIVAFPQSGLLTAPGTAALLEAALSNGADLVGGLDPAGIDNDPVAHLDLVFELADRHQRGLDLHLHDRGTLGRWELGLIIERTRALELHGRVTVSHTFCLCDGDPTIAALIEDLAEAGIGLATV